MSEKIETAKPRKSRRQSRRILRAVVTTSAITSGVVSILAWVLQGLLGPLVSSLGQQLARKPAVLDFYVLEQKDDGITFVVKNDGGTPAVIDAIAYCPAAQAYFSSLKHEDEFWAVSRSSDRSDHFSQKVDLLGPASTEWNLSCFTGEMHRLLPFVYKSGSRSAPSEASVEVTFEAVPGLRLLTSKARLNPGVGGFCGGVLMSEGRSYAKILECVSPSNPLADPATVDEEFRVLRAKRAQEEVARDQSPAH